MPSIVFRLTKDEAATLGVPFDDAILAEAPFEGSTQPPTAINWDLVEKAASELRTDNQGFARILLAARAEAQHASG